MKTFGSIVQELFFFSTVLQIGSPVVHLEKTTEKFCRPRMVETDPGDILPSTEATLNIKKTKQT